MTTKHLLIAFSLAGLLAWILGRRGDAPPPRPRVTAPPPSDPGTGSYAHWRALDDAAILAMSKANAARMLAAGAGDGTAEARARAEYDRQHALHQRYAAESRSAWDRENGMG